MDVAAGQLRDDEAPAPASSSIYPMDLVSFESEGGGGHGERGVVIEYDGVSHPVAMFHMIRVDGSLVAKKGGDLTVVDRSSFHPGQVVASELDPGGQIGVVTGVATVLDLVQLDGPPAAVVRGVSPARLRRVRELSLGDYVLSGPWLGRVVEVSLNVDVLFDDGAVCRVTGAESNKLIVMNPRKLYCRHQMNSPFYPGKRVTANDPSAVFRASRWLNGHWHSLRVHGTVRKVKMAGVLVYWIASAQLGNEQQLVQASAPPPYQKPRDLTFFCSDFYCTWGLADRCFLRTARRRRTGFKLPMSVADTHTTVDVLWQDGTRRHGVPSASLIPFGNINEHEFFPEEIVVDNAAPGDAPPPEFHVAAAAAVVEVAEVTGVGDDDGSISATNDNDETADAAVQDAADVNASTGSTRRRIGVVRSLNAEDKTVRVSWLKAASRHDGAREVECEETVSAYDLVSDPEHQVYYGAVVVRLPPSSETTGNGGGSTEVLTPAQGNNNDDNMKAAAAAGDLSWVGRIVDLRDGHVLVKWGDGSTSMVFPHDIGVIRQQHYMDLQDEMGYWDDDDEATEDGARHDHPAAANTNPAEARIIDSNVQRGGDGSMAAAMARVGAAVWSVFRLAREVLARGKRYLVNGPPPPSSGSELPAVTGNVEAPAPVSDYPNGAATEAAIAAAAVTSSDAGVDHGDGSDEEEGKKAAVAVGDDDDPFRFPNFDIVQCPLDHHYLDIEEQGTIIGGKKWVKTVQKEWEILKNSLPDSMYVRAFEDRMDLLRAAMVGAAGTPYHDGLFLFDLHLPPSYPAEPPQVYYHSFGFRLNPNLYASGTVCLSLLNTFGEGEGDDAWSPARSSLLQVVVSIQGLVLTAQPYYNEAGYEALIGMPEGHRNALPYGENAYLLTLRTALQLLRRPPRGFEGFVRDHFHRRGRFVLGACEVYLRGCPVGTLTADGRGGGERPCSAGFRLALANLVPKLLVAFEEIGAEGCEQFEELRCPRVGDLRPPSCALTTGVH